MLVTTRKKASAAAVRTPLSTQISRQLRARIVSGELALGAELPSESELTRELGVSRSTVREALRILQAQGLLAPTGAVSTRRPRVSTEELISHAAAQALENLVKLAELPLHDLVELRVVLEGAAVEAAARNQGASLAEARLALAQMQQRPLDADAFRAADLQFHRALLGAAGNAAFPLVMGVLRAAISSHLGEALQHEVDLPATMTRLTREHATILEAVGAGHGAKARTLVAGHIRSFYRRRVQE